MAGDNVVLLKSYNFAVRAIKIYQHLSKEKKEFILSKQLLKSGTSIGANVEEAMGGSSKKDFIAKLRIAYREARETKYWLRLLHDTDYIDTKSFNSMFDDCEELLKLLYSIIKSSKQ